MTACVDAVAKHKKYNVYKLLHSLFPILRGEEWRHFGEFNKHKDKSVEKRLQRDMKNYRFFNTRG